MFEELEKIKDVIWECITLAVNSEKNEVIFMDTDGRRPEGLYTTLKIDPYEVQQNDEYINLPDGNIEQRTRGSFIVSLQMYRAGALSGSYNLNKKLRQKSFLDHCAIKFREAGLCIVIREIGEVRDLTALVETNYEERSQMDIVFNYTTATIDKGVDGKGLGFKFPVNVIGNYKSHKEDGQPISKTIVIDK